MYCYDTARACGFQESCETALSYLAPTMTRLTKTRPSEINGIRYAAPYTTGNGKYHGEE